MENNILTAEEMEMSDEFDSYQGMMIKFTKLHLEAQKKAIKLKISAFLEPQGIYLTDDWDLEKTGNTVIDEAYPLTNIK